MWLGRVAAFAFKHHLKLIGRREKRARADREGSRRRAWPIVHAVNLLDVPTVHHAVLAHLTTAAAAFFGRLEDHHGCAVKIAGLSQILRCTQKHGGMAVMPTGMHRALVFRRILKPSRLMDRQRIHIGAQAHDLAAVGPSFDDPDDSGAANAFDHLITAKGAQFFGDKGRGAVGFKQDFRMRMNVASPFGDIRVQLGKTVLYWHISGPRKIRSSSGADQ